MPDTVTDAFECFEPNAATLAAIAEAALGNLVTTHSVAEFMAELNQNRHSDAPTRPGAPACPLPANAPHSPPSWPSPWRL